MEPVARTDLTEIPNPSVDHVEIFTFTNYITQRLKPTLNTGKVPTPRRNSAIHSPVGLWKGDELAP